MKLRAIPVLLTLGAIVASAWLLRTDAIASPQKVILAPKYVPGQVVRYQLQTTTRTESQRGGAIQDPQGPGQLTITWNAITRMEVLSAGQDASGKPDGSVRLRSTYEKSAATADSTTYDPEADSIESRYHELEGRSFEFTLDATGHVKDIQGFADLRSTGPDSGADALRAWLGQFSSVAGGPRGGIAVGETWTTDQPVASAPLANLVWRARSTYERNEPCQAGRSAGAADPTAGQTCAVILSKLELTGSRPGKDATPESYKDRGLRTEGSWTGSGDSLTYVSLATGRLVSVTQTSSEQMDFTVSTTGGEKRMVYKGAVQSRSRMELLPAAKQ